MMSVQTGAKSHSKRICVWFLKCLVIFCRMMCSVEEEQECPCWPTPKIAGKGLEKNKTWRGDFQLGKNHGISWSMLCIYPRTQDAIVANKGLGWDSLQELSKNPGGFHLSYAEGEASLVGMTFFTSGFHRGFKTSSFFKQQVFGCWPDKKTPSLDSYFACHRYTDIFSLFHCKTSIATLLVSHSVKEIPAGTMTYI